MSYCSIYGVFSITLAILDTTNFFPQYEAINILVNEHPKNVYLLYLVQYINSLSSLLTFHK